MSDWNILVGDCIEQMQTLPEKSVQCCVTSPPYFGLRDYQTASWEGGDPDCTHTVKAASRAERPKGLLGGGTRTVDAGTVHRDCHCGATRIDRQLGLEKTPELYVEKMVSVFREVRRVLADDGTLWLNIGDSYAGSGKGGQSDEKRSENWQPEYPRIGETARVAAVTNVTRLTFPGIKAKDLIGIPWMLAFALRADGWYLRSDIIWHKPNPMPESVTDRPTKAHEHLFLLTKSPRYYYDAVAIQEPTVTFDEAVRDRDASRLNDIPGRRKMGGLTLNDYESRNKRSVWSITTEPYRDAHFAVMPTKLVEPCILAGTKAGDTVLDPFAGAGTVGLVANRLGRDFVGTELNPKYAEIARRRITDDAPLFSSGTAA